jgi:trans-2,3-dihydro-3-hydroxyanthranilate isomerase
VLDADGLEQDVMQGFARETRLSETTFVQSATEDGADYRNRIFMTTQELPFAGHPSLGTAVAVALARGESEARYVQQTQAGLQPIEVRVDGRAGKATIVQEAPEFGPEVDPAEALAAVGLEPSSALARDTPPQVVSTGLAQVIVPVQRHALERARPDREAIAALFERYSTTATLYLSAWEPGSGRAHTRSFFVDVDGITEDPATGSAAGPLAVHLARHGRVPFGTEIEIVQGVEIGRRSVMRARVDGAPDAIERVAVGGSAVIVARGEYLLD